MPPTNPLTISGSTLTFQASDPRQWTELFAAFDTLVELDAGARAERLAAIGATDPAARRALEELLAADANASSSLDRLDAVFGVAGNADRDVLRLVGKTVAHFRIVEPLATGGMGVVYRALDTHLARSVALKFPLPGQRLDRQVRERFLREARAAGALDHPNICSIFESGETADGQLFFAMPLYEGETLKAQISRAGRLPVADALAIAIQIGQGLQAAHRAGIVHRDLKPANVMILSDGRVKILDFGIARVGDVTLTRSHDTLGTVSYMAPEQVRGEQVDGRADLWALGVLLYEMFTGRRPFEGQHEIAIAHAIVHATPVRPSVLRPEIWPELDALVLGLLAEHPQNRRATAEAVAAELTALQPQSPASTVRRWRPSFTTLRPPLLWVCTLALLVTAVGVTAWLLGVGTTRGSAEPRSVAVLPFENLGAGEDSDYLAIALPDAIATQLSGLKAVAVLAGEPGASAIVRGSVRRAGDEIQIQIGLFDAIQNGRTRTREYHGAANTLLTLQQHATQGVVTALDLDLTSAERALLTRAPTTSGEAYDLYLRGRAAQIRAASDSQRETERLQQAQSYALARDRDPSFAAPRASLATSHLALARYDRTSARRDQARLEAEAALRLQPGMPEAHEALAAYWLLRDDQVNAINELEQALATRPSAPHLYSLLGTTLRRLGRLEEAAAAFERASRLDARNSRLHRDAALTYARLRRYEQAIAHWDRVIAMDSSGDPFPQIIRGFAYLRHGDVDSLDAAIRRIPLGRDAGGLTTYAHYLVHCIARRPAEALASLDSARVAISVDGPDGVLYRPVALLRGQTLERMGDRTRARSAYEASRALLEDSVAAHPQEARMRVALGLTYAGLRRHTDAMREARRATELAAVSKQGISFPAATAAMGGAVEIYAQLGETDAALEVIELLLAMPAGREVSVPLLRLDPTFDPLRSDPRFEALLVRFSKS